MLPSKAAAAGPSTQRDPIGLAGGMNQYGYVGGDPVNYSDPLGLVKKLNGEAARQFWRDLQSAVSTGLRSQDTQVRQAARVLRAAMNEIENLADTVDITVRVMSASELAQTGGGFESCSIASAGNCSVLVGTNSPAGGLTTLAHELGGAVAARGRHASSHADPVNGALKYENAFRRLIGCNNPTVAHYPEAGPPPAFCK